VLSRHDIARSFLIEAYADLEAARVLEQAGIYARCLAHCQHAVEKALKAALAVKGVIITDRHEVSEDFRETYADWPRCQELADIAFELENIGFRTEYPLFGRRDLPIWIPSERYTETEAREALQEACQVFQAIEEYLAAEHNVRR
jgi:HEPN domain-containing protein